MPTVVEWLCKGDVVVLGFMIGQLGGVGEAGQFLEKPASATHHSTILQNVVVRGCFVVLPSFQ